jgi:hypothetical protein
MGGHVFIVHGDITRLAADAWLLPGGSDAKPGEAWEHAVGDGPLDRPVKNERVVRWKKLREHDPEPFLVGALGGSSPRSCEAERTSARAARRSMIWSCS